MRSEFLPQLFWSKLEYTRPRKPRHIHPLTVLLQERTFLKFSSIESSQIGVAGCARNFMKPDKGKLFFIVFRCLGLQLV